MQFVKPSSQEKYQTFCYSDVVNKEKQIIFFAFGQLNQFFCYSRLNTKQNLLKIPNSNGSHMHPKPPAAQSVSKKLSKNMESKLVEGSNIKKLKFSLASFFELT